MPGSTKSEVVKWCAKIAASSLTNISHEYRLIEYVIGPKDATWVAHDNNWDKNRYSSKWFVGMFVRSDISTTTAVFLFIEVEGKRIFLCSFLF